MRKLMTFGILITLALFIAMPVSASVLEYYDTFDIRLGQDGSIVEGGGTGYPSTSANPGVGEWYTYESGWINQWFYNGPFDPLRWKRIWGVINIDPLGAAAYPEIVINWATPEWQNTGIEGPPLPGMFDPVDENLYIMRMPIAAYDPADPTSIPFNFYEEIREYNPEWISIDVMGADVVVIGEIWHECVPEPATLSLLALGGLALIARRRKG